MFRDFWRLRYFDQITTLTYVLMDNFCPCFRFAVKNVLRPYGILFSNYAKNSKTTNHYIIKMFHRFVNFFLPYEIDVEYIF